jgi:hypothetical protein
MGATIKMFSQDTVMQRISKSTLKLWRKQDSEQKLGRESRGRKPCPAFETALLSELLYVSSVHASDGKEGPAEVRVKANAMFSYALIQSTARELQSTPTWKEQSGYEGSNSPTFGFAGSYVVIVLQGVASLRSLSVFLETKK